MAESFEWGLLGKEDINLGTDQTFTATLPDGTVGTLNKINLTTFSASRATASLPTAGTAGRVSQVSDLEGGLWMDSGTQWVKQYPFLNMADAPYNTATGQDLLADLTATVTALTASGGTIFIPKGTYTLTNDVTVPSNIALMAYGVTITKTAGKSLFINGPLLSQGGDLFGSDGNTVLGFPAATKTVLSGQLGIGGKPNLQNLVDVAGSWSGTVDAIGLAITTRLSPVTNGSNTAGIDVVPTLIASDTPSYVGYGMGIECAPSFTRTGSGQFGRIVTGLKVRDDDIPVNVLMPYAAVGPLGYSVGTAFGIFVQPPTNAGVYTQYMYAGAFIGRIALVGESEIRFQTDIAETRGTIGRSTGAGQYCSGTATNDLAIVAYDPINLVAHSLFLTENQDYPRIKLASTGTMTWVNNNGAHGDVVFGFIPTAFGNKGAFGFGASPSGNTPFYVDFPSMTATGAGADHYTMQLAASGTTSITSGATVRAAGLRIAAPQYSLSGGATIANAFSLNVSGAPNAGTAKGCAWFESGDVIVGGSALATNATSGFFHIPSCAGAPTGVPANIIAADAPMIVDTTNNRLYVYHTAAWHYTALT